MIAYRPSFRISCRMRRRPIFAWGADPFVLAAAGLIAGRFDVGGSPMPLSRPSAEDHGPLDRGMPARHPPQGSGIALAPAEGHRSIWTRTHHGVVANS